MSVTGESTLTRETLNNRNAGATAGHCQNCKEFELLTPLHLDRGGPLFCLRCGMDWHGKHGRRRNAGRRVIKVIKAYLDAGGKFGDIDKLKLAALGGGLINFNLKEAQLAYEDETGVDMPDLTTELLNDIFQLVHPDHQPPERRALATRVTKELNALKPFVFPAPLPKPPPVYTPTPSDASFKSHSENLKKPSQCYPCEDCADHLPFYYCNQCKTEWNRQNEEKWERERAKQRKWYKRRKEVSEWRKPDFNCICGKRFKPLRADSKYCSSACRQKAYRRKKDGDSTEERPNQWRTQWIQARDRRALIRAKWKKVWSLPIGSKVFVNGVGNKHYPRGTRLEITGLWGWKIHLKTVDEKRANTFSSRDVAAFDIIPENEA